MDRLPTRVAVSGAIAATVVGLAGCAPAPATSEGARVKELYDLFMATAAVVFVTVTGLIGWSIVRYRWRGAADAPSQFRDNPRLELAWWAIPTLLVIGLFVVTAQVLGEVDERTNDPAVTVTVTGFQWQWRFAYEGTDVVVEGQPGVTPELVLPVGERIAFDLESPDVIHSFWVPNFLIKRDVVPGRTNRFEVTINESEAGSIYRGQCGEFCGLLHADMRFTIRAVSAEEFQTWLEGGG